MSIVFKLSCPWCLVMAARMHQDGISPDCSLLPLPQPVRGKVIPVYFTQDLIISHYLHILGISDSGHLHRLLPLPGALSQMMGVGRATPSLSSAHGSPSQGCLPSLTTIKEVSTSTTIHLPSFLYPYHNLTEDTLSSSYLLCSPPNKM